MAAIMREYWNSADLGYAEEFNIECDPLLLLMLGERISLYEQHQANSKGPLDLEQFWSPQSLPFNSFQWRQQQHLDDVETLMTVLHHLQKPSYLPTSSSACPYVSAPAVVSDFVTDVPESLDSPMLASLISSPLQRSHSPIIFTGSPALTAETSPATTVQDFLGFTLDCLSSHTDMSFSSLHAIRFDSGYASEDSKAVWTHGNVGLEPGGAPTVVSSNPESPSLDAFMVESDLAEGRTVQTDASTSTVKRRRKIRSCTTTFPCPHCSTIFRRNHDRTRHIRSKHATHDDSVAPPTKHLCSDCGRSFARADTLLKHVKVVEEKRRAKEASTWALRMRNTISGLAVIEPKNHLINLVYKRDNVE